MTVHAAGADHWPVTRAHTPSHEAIRGTSRANGCPHDRRPPGPLGRTALSKSALSVFDICQQKSWFEAHDRRPFVPIEKVTFGSALDAAIEVVIGYARMGQPVDMGRALDAARFIIDRDETGTSLDEVAHATARFLADVLPERDWSHALTQVHIAVTLDGLGECDGHPDIIDGTEVWDVKATTGKSAKEPRSLELGFYAILREAETGVPVTRVGYMEWRRSAPHGSLREGKWVTPSVEVTPEFRRWSYERAAAYVRAKRADELLNRKAAEPRNWSFPGFAVRASFCTDCVYAPANGGPCALAYREEIA
jgi:hypothetical protein